MGLPEPTYSTDQNPHMEICLSGSVENKVLVQLGLVNKKRSERFDIKQDTWYADINWNLCLEQSEQVKLAYREVPRYPTMFRDLAFVDKDFLMKVLNFATSPA